MSERPFFDTSDPDVFYRLQMAALLARRTLLVNTGRTEDAGLDPAAEGDLDSDTVARVFAETPCDHVAITFHTSGSTGQPKPVPHSWGHLVGDAKAIAASVGMTPGMSLTTVLTVPMDHMFGFSYGFMLTNVMGFARPKAKVVSPKSLHEALEAAETPVVLVTTPTHLRIYADSTIARFPNVAWLFCATSPLPEGLAEVILQKFGTPVTDIYGCTEAGTLAYRVMDEPSPDWRCLDGVSLRRDGERHIFETDYFDAPVVMDDRLEITHPGRFRFLGRSSDLVKIGGKRQSLAGMARIVESLPNVREAAFFLPPDEPNARLVLLAVFEGPPDFDAVRAKLAGAVDPVFMPRHCIAADALPRNANGKLPLSSLVAAHRESLRA